MHFSQDQSKGISEEISSVQSKCHENRHSEKDLKSLGCHLLLVLGLQHFYLVMEFQLDEMRFVLVLYSMCTQHVLTEELSKNELVVCGNYIL